MAKRLSIGLAIVCVLIIGFIIFMPETRQEIFGARLRHNLQVGRAEDVITVAQLLSGNEIRPLSANGNVLPDPNVNTENYDVRIGFQESVKSLDNEEVLTYSIDGIESEQIGTKSGSDAIGNFYRLRLNQLGLPIDFTRTEGQPSKVFDDMRLTQIMASWWPGLPNKRVRKGDSWSARWSVPYIIELLDGKKISLRHDLQYFLEDIKAENGLNIANVTFKGTIEPTDFGELPEDTEIAGTGTIAGNAYIDVTTGQTIVSDERLIWSVVVRLRDEDMEVVQFADRNSRTYRPRYLPNGDAGFKRSSTESTSAEGLPTAGKLMQNGDKDKGKTTQKQPNKAPQQQNK